MLDAYIKAAFKRAGYIDLAKLQALQRAPRVWRTLLPTTKHYQRYCSLVEWHNVNRVHPFYWQVKSLPLQLQLLNHGLSPFSILGLVHLDNVVSVYNHSRVDIPCELMTRFGESYQHRKGIVFAITVTATQRGKPVYCASGRYLMRTLQKVAGLPDYVTPASQNIESADSQQEFVTNVALARQYAWVSGDYNPIHLSGLSARLFGFKQAIMHGMWSGARVISALDEKHALTDEEITIAFKHPLTLPQRAQLQVASTLNGDGRILSLRGGKNNDTTFLVGKIQSSSTQA